MIVTQHNGYRDIRVTVTDQGVTLDSGWGTETDFKVEQTVSLTEGDRRILYDIFSAGLPKTSYKWQDLSDNRKFQVYGVDSGDFGDWAIWRDKKWVLQGSFNFEGMTSALLRPFKEQIFMGAGEQSIHEMKELVHLVQRGCGLLSGVQQCFIGPDHDPEGASKGELEIQGIVRQVALALTGKEIEFK